MRSSTFVLLWILSCFCVLPSTADKVDVVLLAGQSNMQGSASLDGLPAPFEVANPHVRFWTGDAFEPLIPGVTKTSARASQFGPEIGFAHALASLEPGRPIHIVKFFRSGQPLHHGWDAGRWVGGEPAPGRRTFYPGVDISDPNIGVHYQAMLIQAKGAFQALRVQGHEPVLRAVVWMQGEADSKHEQSAGAYAHSIARLKSRIEHDLGSSAVPFVFGQVLPHEPALDRFTSRKLIREQQRRVDMRSGAPESTAGCWMVSTDGMPRQKDTVHYDAIGQAMLGQAFAMGMLQAEHHLAMIRALNPCLQPVSSQETRGAAAGWGVGRTWMDQHEHINAIAQKPLDVVLLGDSITQSWGGEGRSVGSPGGAARQKHLEHWRLGNFGISGDRTEHILWRIEHGNFDGPPPRVVVLMIGTNNLSRGHTPAQISEGIHAIVNTLQWKLPESQILLLGTFPRGADASDPMRKRVQELNRLIAPLGQRERVRFLDLASEFVEPTGAASPTKMAGDKLHLTAQGYDAWGAAMAPVLKEMLGN